MAAPRRYPKGVRDAHTPMKTALVLCVAGVLAGRAQPSAHAAPVAKDTGQVLVAPAEYTLVHRMPGEDFQPTAAYRWLDVLLEASGRDAQRNSPRPTILSRTMALVLTSMYDAWAAYDEVAVGTRLGASLRRPAAERTQANKETAIAYGGLSLAPVRVSGRRSLDSRSDFASRASTPTTPPLTRARRRASGTAGRERRHRVPPPRRCEPAGRRDRGATASRTRTTPATQPKNTPDNDRRPDPLEPIPFSDGKGGTIIARASSRRIGTG